ncbi:hypothetical protein VE03_08540 [Pseudogymnoascus sp. 23342-1-I1]|nr:hypothetical protein VE03_08540 [Pseudogymnoascus sp. 23342-1-I1]
MSETTQHQPAATGEDSKPQTPETKEAQIVESATPTEDVVEKTSTFSGDFDPNDAKDPKNWSNTRKHLIFAALMSSSLLCDGGMTWGATLLFPQHLQWQIELDKAATSMNYGILLQGFGGIFAVPLIEAYGRLPVWFWTQVITMGMVIGCALSPTFGIFTTFRSLQGLFGTVPQVIGLPIIYDMYHHRDWPRMINIWGTTFLMGPFLGPAIAGYVLYGTGKWESSFAVLAGLYGASTLAILAVGRETYYQKGLNTQETPRWKSFLGLGNTGTLNKLSTVVEQSKLLVIMIFTPPLLLVGLATMVNFTWPIGITVTISSFLLPPPYLLTAVQDASMRWAGFIGALLGFVFGYFFNSWIYLSTSPSGMSRRANWRPEYRLHGVWGPIFSMAIGLVIYGLTLNFQKSWVGLAFGWIMVNLGMIASTVAITAFALEKYPAYATIVSAIINMWRTCGGFAVGYFQPSWIARSGVGVVFGLQAVVVSVCIVLFITPVIWLGKREAARRIGSGGAA